MGRQPDKRIEDELEAWSRQRKREGGPDPELHPATRRLLQVEVTRKYRQGDATNEGGFFAQLHRWLRPLALAGGICAVLLLAFSVLLPPPVSRSKQRTLAKQKLEAASPDPALRRSTEPLATGDGQMERDELKPGSVSRETSEAAITGAKLKKRLPNPEPAFSPGLASDALELEVPPESFPAPREALSSFTSSLPRKEAENARKSGEGESGLMAADSLLNLESKSRQESTDLAPGNQPSLALTGAGSAAFSQNETSPRLANEAPTLETIDLAEARRNQPTRQLPPEISLEPPGSFFKTDEGTSTPASVATPLPEKTLLTAAPATPAAQERELGGSSVHYRFQTSEIPAQAGMGGGVGFQNLVVSPNGERRGFADGATNAPLQLFRLQLNDTNLRFVDADGSVYRGSLLTRAAGEDQANGIITLTDKDAGSLDLRLPQALAPTVSRTRAVAPAGGTQYYFQASGTNVSLGLPVRFNGQLILPIRTNLRSDATASTPAGAAPLALPAGLPDESRISGTAVVGESNRVEVEAVVRP